MYTCINCGAEVDELFRRYSPSVLKVVKCKKCGNLADKYIEYDPVIVLVDLVLLEKPAYRHLLNNSDFTSYWKLMIVLLLGESFRRWSSYDPVDFHHSIFNKNNIFFQGERHFYVLLAHSTLCFCTFATTVLLATEIRWIILQNRPRKYKATHLLRALTIGGFTKLLALLGIVWHHIQPDPHNLIIHGYTVLSLLTAYSVVCETGRIASFFGLAGGFFAYNYVYNMLPQLYPVTSNITLNVTKDYSSI